jgi:transcription elongation factor SPT4
MFSPFVTFRNNINILKKHTAVAHPKYIISQGIPNLDSAPGEIWLNVPGKSETMSGVSMRDLRACMVCSIVQRFSVCLLLPPCPPLLNPSRALLPQFIESIINPILTSSLPPPQDFRNRGCPNCEPILGLANHPEAIQDCTSRVFEGLITMAQPTQSWVAKWQRLEGYVAGVYAVKVVGELHPDMMSVLEGEGVKYIPRDGRDVDEDR